MIFQTKTNLTQKQVKEIKDFLDAIFDTDFIIYLDAQIIAWYTDEETV